MRHEDGQTVRSTPAHLVAGDKLVGEGQPGHQAALLEPEDGGKRAGEENALNARERNEALGE